MKLINMGSGQPSGDEDNTAEMDQTGEPTEDITEDQLSEGGEENEEEEESDKNSENDEAKSEENSMDGEENEDNEDGEGGEENEEGEGGEENEEDVSTIVKPVNDACAVSVKEVEPVIEAETKKKKSLMDRFNEMDRKLILFGALFLSLVISLPSGLGIGLGTAPIPDYCSYPMFQKCRDHGKCEIVSTFASCKCDDGWTGDTCEILTCDNPNACVTSKTASCVNSKTRGPICTCKNDFHGHDCSKEQDESLGDTVNDWFGR